MVCAGYNFVFFSNRQIWVMSSWCTHFTDFSLMHLLLSLMYIILQQTEVPISVFLFFEQPQIFHIAYSSFSISSKLIPVPSWYLGIISNFQLVYLGFLYSKFNLFILSILYQPLIILDIFKQPSCLVWKCSIKTCLSLIPWNNPRLFNRILQIIYRDGRTDEVIGASVWSREPYFTYTTSALLVQKDLQLYIEIV